MTGENCNLETDGCDLTSTQTWPLLIIGGLLGALASGWMGSKAAVFPAAALAVTFVEGWLR